jgi:hypothetical protein
MQARRERTDHELFDGEPPPDGLRSLADVGAAWQAGKHAGDYDAIAQELGCKRDEVSFVIHAGRERKGNRIVDFYELSGSFGPGAEYDIAADARAATRLTHELMQRGAASITGAAAKKS